MDDLKRQTHKRNFGNLDLEAKKLSSKRVRISKEDCAVVRLQMVANHSLNGNVKDDKILGSGTGFVVRYGDKKYFITCWHNFTGLHHEKRDWISSNANLRTYPTHIIAQNTYINALGNGFNKQRFALYGDDDNPIWRVHKNVKNFYDIVVIQYDDSEAPHRVPYLDIEKDGLIESLLMRDDIFVAGYPSNDMTNQFLPIWKSGCIASSPQLPYSGHPKFLIDASTRGGMSGSPVFLVVNDGVEDVTYGENKTFTKIRHELLFLGLYSARIPTLDSSKSSDLGYVWKKDTIIEIIENGVRDCCPEHGIEYPEYKYQSD